MQQLECNYYNSNIGYFDRLDHVPCVIQELVFILINTRLKAMNKKLYCRIVGLQDLIKEYKII